MASTFEDRIQMTALMFVPFMMAVVIHEFGHGLMAKKWGDRTAMDSGRLTLNPIPHIDPLGTVVFPLIVFLTGTPFLFGWAKPVPINPSRFHKFRPGLFWVSLAGPMMNVLLAIISAALCCAILAWVPQTFYLYEPLKGMMYVSISLNYALAIFNLIPLPPLDGSKIVESILPYEMAQKYEAISQYSFFILMALMFTGLMSFLSYPIRLFSELTLGTMAWIFGLTSAGGL